MAMCDDVQLLLCAELVAKMLTNRVNNQLQLDNEQHVRLVVKLSRVSCQPSQVAQVVWQAVCSSLEQQYRWVSLYWADPHMCVPCNDAGTIAIDDCARGYKLPAVLPTAR